MGMSVIAILNITRQEQHRGRSPTVYQHYSVRSSAHIISGAARIL